MKKFLLLGALAFAFLGAAAAQDFSKIEDLTTPLGHNMYALSGGGGNITLAVGSDGIIMVDAQFAPLHDKIKAAIAKLSPLPVKYLINTHYHIDHVGGNEAFAKEGAIIVAHANVPLRMANPPPDANGKPRAVAPKGAMPMQTYSGQGTEVKIPGQTAELVHLEGGHTDGDTAIFWPAANVITTGDVVTYKSYPNIDVTAGGGVDGMIAAAKFIVAHADAHTKIVPGHGPVTDRKGVLTYIKMMQTARARVAKAKASGMTEDQVVNAHLFADLDKDWLTPEAGPVSLLFPRNIYRSIP